jgi:hypothetical protein
MIAFCTLSALLFQALALVNPRRGFYIYLASLPLLPAYIAIPLVKGGAGISLIRMMTYALAVALVVAILRNPKGWIPVFRRIGKWPGFLFWMGALYLAKLISTATNQEAIALVYWLDEFIGVSVVFVLAIRYVTNMDELRKIFIILLPILFIQLAVVGIEALMMHPILKGLVEVNVSTVGGQVAQGYERDGTYRVIGMFENPLSLAEYLLVGVVMVFGAYGARVVDNRLFFFFGLACIFGALYLTGARYSAVVLGLSLVFTVVFFYGYRLGSNIRPIVLVLAACLLLSVGYFGYLAVTDVYWLLDITSGYLSEGQSATASLIERAGQYLIVPAEIIGNPFWGLLGEGVQSGLIERLDVRLDNHYLRVLIEGGLLGLISFVVLIVLSFAHAVLPSNYKHQPQRYVRGVRFFFIMFFALFAINKFFLSMSYNNQYFFIFSGIALSLLSKEISYKKTGGRIAYPART